MGELGMRRRPPRLRRARPGDAEQLARLEASCFPVTDRFSRATWARLSSSSSALVLLSDRGRSTPAAAICWLMRRGSTVARMYSLAVHPTARGQGLAKSLIGSSLRRLPAHVDRLSLEVRYDNAAARALYATLGFTLHQRLPRYYPDGGTGVRLRAARRRIGNTLAG